MPAYHPHGLSVLPRSASSAQTRQKLKRGTMLAAALASGILLPAMVQAQALPTGGQVAAGSAGIATSGPNLTVSQTSDKAVIDWSSFSVGQGNAVQFNNGSGATLNRVTGGNLSSIDGLLSATGSVYLINPNGVVIGKSGVVKVGGGFFAATLDIGNANFMGGGDLTFEGPSLASVVNLGQIGALGGDVALVAANVRNDGTINASNGALGLLAGNRILMRDSGVNDGKFLVLSGGAGTSVNNTGSIEAATAELRAEGGNVYALAGNTQGLIRATGVSTHDGRIFLSAGSGSVEVSASLLSATQNGEGGTIAVTGQKISVASDARLDASGAHTGGSVTAIADMASGRLDFHGTALAKGSLNGGFVETSGRKVDFSGARIETTGAKPGNWLVDPDDLTVDDGAAATIQSNLGTTNVTLQTTATTATGPGSSSSGSGDIIVNSDITWSSANTLTLDSYHSIQVNANLTASGAGGVVLTTNNGGSGGDYYFALGKSLGFTGSGGSLTINGSAYTLIYTVSGLSSLESAANGKFALAKSLDFTGTNYTTTSTNPVNNTGTSSIFTGLGHTVSNLTLSKTSNTTGFIGNNYGTVRDIGIFASSVSAGSYVGGLVGYNRTGASLINLWSNLSVDGTGSYVGGLVGYNAGSIRNSFSSATVGAVKTNSQWTGGLVGINYGAISNTYATGNVWGSWYTGGLAGQNQTGGTITSSYATGIETGGGGHIGGLVGGSLNPGTALPNSVYDSETTGQGGYGTGQTTAQLQDGNLPSGFSSSVWNTAYYQYPYLKTFFPNGVAAVSGIAYNSGNTAVSKAAVKLYSGGALLGTAYSGANGYYYIFVPTGTGGDGAGLTETLNGSSSVTGAIYTDYWSPSGGATNQDITSGTFLFTPIYNNYSTIKTLAAAAFGPTYYASLLSTLSSGSYKVSANTYFSVDSALDTTSTNVTFQTTSYDLSLDTDLTVSGTTALTLEGYVNLHLNGNVIATGTNAITLNGNYDLRPGKSLSFTNTAGAGQSLSINGNSYGLIYTASDLQNIEFQPGYFALARSLDFTSTPFTSSVADQVDGTFTGLGNTITGLTINGTGNDYMGLFGTVSNTGSVRDIGLNGGTVYGHYYSGTLVGHNEGTITNAWSSADARVAYRSGGLVGYNEGTISKSHATGAVTSLGDNGGGVSDMGGLVGWNGIGAVIDQSYATGTVTGISNTTGGLVAYNGGGTISNSFATGGVFGNLYAGGLVGFGDNNGTITNSYATGYVHANSNGGGLAGHFIGTITDSYWDKTSSGIASVGVGDGTATGAVGMTRTALQNGSLPTGFSGSIWATDNGLYPYLKELFPAGMQSISGTTLASNGSVLPAATLAVYVNGTQVGGTTAASGADGYYYLMAQPGTVTNSTHIGITETDHGGSTVSGLAYIDAPVLTGGQVTGFDVRSGRAIYTTADTTYSALKSNAQTTFGSSTYSALTTALDGAALKIAASGAFGIDQAISRSGSTLIQSGGDLTITSGGSVASTASGTAVTLAADGSFINNAGASSVSASNGRWLIYTQAHGNATAAATGNSFGGLSGKSFYNDAFNFTTGALATAPSSGNRFVTGYAPVLTVAPDTKTLVYSGAAQTDSYGVTGYLTGDQSADNLTGSVTGLAVSSKNVGAYSLTASGTLVSEENYTISYGSGTLTIGKADLTVAAVTDSKTYDTGVTSTGIVTVTGLKGSDTVTGKTQAFDSKNAGTRTLSVTGYTLNDGNSGGNYTVTTQTAAGSIARAALTLAAGTDSKTYDAGTTSTGTVTVTGLLGSDTVTGKSQAFDSKNAGTRTLSVTGYTLNDGNSGGNYTVTTQTAAGSIAKAALTLAAGTDSKPYDADKTSAGTITVTGLKGSDTVTGKSQEFDSKNAGTRTLSVTGYTLNDGNSGGNYTVTTHTAAGSIAKAALTIAAGTDSKTYDSTTTSIGTVTVTGLLGSDTVTGKSQAFDSKNAGSRTLSITGYTVNDGNSGGNYTVTTHTAAGSIAKAALTIAAGTDSKTYDASTASTGTVSVAGLKGSDTVIGTSQSFDSKNAGVRTLSVGGYTVNDGNSGSNYTVTTQTASGSIAKAALTIAAGTDSKTYDSTTTSTGTVTVTGLLGSDTVTGKTQVFDSKNAGTRTLNVTGYTVNDGNSGGNYAVATHTAAGSIAKAALAAGLTGWTSKTYDASLNATLTADNYVLTGRKGSDTVSLDMPLLGSYADINTGTGKAVSVTGLTLLGSDAGNYTVNDSATAAIGSISARKLTLAADNLGKNAGAADPVFTYVLTSGSLAGTDALSGGLARAAGEDPGVYDINQGSLSASANYDVTFVKGAFTVTAVALQNNPVVNPINSSANAASQPVIQPAPIGLSGPVDAGGSASDASGTGAFSDDGNNDDGASSAGSAAGDGNEKATGPSVRTAGQTGSTCADGDACANTPYPTNQTISSSISFTSR